MAISKIMHMSDGGKGRHGKHLKQAIKYILNPEKTQNGVLSGTVNCTLERAYEDMINTKKHYGKIDKRQGYHFVIAFVENEVDPATAMAVTKGFINDYFGDRYEAVYAVHNNTNHIHSHIIINSVSIKDGLKYQYYNGDWEKTIQPIVDRLCLEYGLSILSFDKDSRNEWKPGLDGNCNWSEMIKKDIDIAVLKAEGSYDEFKIQMVIKGYKWKEGKHLALIPEGMKRYRRLDTLGRGYTENDIRERVERISFDSTNRTHLNDSYSNTNRSSIRSISKSSNRSINSIRLKEYNIYIFKNRNYYRRKLTGVQKRYIAKLYKLRRIKRRPYSQAYKYRNDIRLMNKLYEEYKFLCCKSITQVSELNSFIATRENEFKITSQDRSKVFKELYRYENLFKVVEQMKQLNNAKLAYENGDEFFKDEYDNWHKLNDSLEGLSIDQVDDLRRKLNARIREIAFRQKSLRRELKTARKILHDVSSNVQKNYRIENKDRVRNKKPRL